MTTTNNDIQFQQWMKQIDNKISSITQGLGTGDLVDICYRDYFDDGLSPDEVVEILAEEEGFTYAFLYRCYERGSDRKGWFRVSRELNQVAWCFFVHKHQQISTLILCLARVRLIDMFINLILFKLGIRGSY